MDSGEFSGQNHDESLERKERLAKVKELATINRVGQSAHKNKMTLLQCFWRIIKSDEAVFDFD